MSAPATPLMRADVVVWVELAQHRVPVPAQQAAGGCLVHPVVTYDPVAGREVVDWRRWVLLLPGVAAYLPVVVDDELVLHQLARQVGAARAAGVLRCESARLRREWASRWVAEHAAHASVTRVGGEASAVAA